MFQMLPGLGLNKSLKIDYQINEAFCRKKQTEGSSWEFDRILGICFNTVRAVFLEILGYIHTYRRTYRKFHFIT